MTEEDDEFGRVQREIEMRQENCKHNWVEGSNTERPAYRCTRCGAWRFVE